MSLSKPNDFAADVLDILRRRNVTFHGCKPDYIEQRSNGECKLWFYGHRKGVAWAGGITLNSRSDIDTAVALGHSESFAEICEKIIDETNTKFN